MAENGALRVLVACEYSGVVRDAFLALGHDAVSCDLLPTDSPGPHIGGDVLPLLREPWDLVIAHPPCTYRSTTYTGIAAAMAEQWGGRVPALAGVSTSPGRAD